jgi:hypothetical protein
MKEPISVDMTEVTAALNGLKSVPWTDALAMVLFRIKALAQLRLTDRGHIVTSRLKNSIYVQMPKQSQANKIGREMGQENNKTYKYEGGSGDREMKTVNLQVGEGAVGTNVEYAGAIEFGSRAHDINSPVLIKGVGWRYIKKHPGFAGDSFLYWAAKNVNKDIADYFKEIALRNQKKYKK